MKRTYFLFLFFAACFCFSEVLQAQVVKQATIIDDLETLVPNQGIIQISCDTKIIELLGILSPEISANEKNYVIMNGFRILVLMSNNPKTAKKEISNRGSLIMGAFPETTIHTGYTPPNWKLLVGDFRTKDEAEVFKQKLLKAIPELGKEMFIVSDKVNIPMQKNK